VKQCRAIFAIARADFLERARRYSFFLTLLFAVILGYSAATGKIYIRLGDYRGVYTSAWIGMMVAMVTTCFVSLVGFYIVKNAIDRDRQTGVGQILATTPLSKSSYLLGKFLSNFAVLASMVFILALSAIVMWFFAAEDPRFDLWALVSPFLLIALPAIALTAALALLFESLPVLRGGVGNVIWVFAWSLGIGLPELTGLPWLDASGLMMVSEQMMAAARATIPGYTGGFSLTLNFEPVTVAQTLRYQGIQWSKEQLFLRLLWFCMAFVLALLAALFFDRFDPTRSLVPPLRRSKPGVQLREAGDVLSPASSVSIARPPASVHLTSLASTAHAGTLGSLFAAELRLALKGLRWWWYVVAAGLLAAQFFAPLELSRGLLLGVAWIWPILIWSAMGARESRFGTNELLFSSARILRRQLPACWFAGVAVALLTGMGAAIRLFLAGQTASLVAWLAGALFLPSFALALGIWSRSGKPYEGLLTALWYIGPMNRTPGLDFTGAANGPLTLNYSVIYLALSTALLTFAFFGRARQLRSD
jgi:hypothetical protein